MDNLKLSPNEQLICAFACGILLIIVIQMICKFFGSHEFFGEYDPKNAKGAYGHLKYFSYDSGKAPWAALVSDYAAPDKHKMGGGCDFNQFDANQSYDIAGPESPGNPGARIQTNWGYSYGPGPLDLEGSTYHAYSGEMDFSPILFGDINMI